MAKVIKFPVEPPRKLGPKKVHKRKKADPEDHGQLNLFNQIVAETRVRSLQSGNDFFEEALALDDQGDPFAENMYLRAIEHEQSIADAYCNLGILMSRREEYAKAVDYLTKSLAVNPRHFEAHYNLANVYSDLGNFGLAKMHYEISTEIAPSFPNSYYNLGLVLVSLKQYDAAAQVIQQYIELSPDYNHEVAHDLIRTLKDFGR
ncbi:MAG: tetratricopeptide repeat protein [Bacteroidota bacterium]